MYAESLSGRHVFMGYSFKFKKPSFIENKQSEAKARREAKAYERELEFEAYLDAIELIKYMRQDNMLYVAHELKDMMPKFGHEYCKQLREFALEQARIILRR